MMLKMVIALASALFLSAGSAYAQTTAQTDYADIRIIMGANGVMPGGEMPIAFDHQVADGWHVFWVNPGDAGLPLALDWSLPPGFSGGEILHPAPRYIPVGPLASYAHEGRPVFVTSIRAPKGAVIGDVIPVSVQATWQTCEDICVPEDASYSFEVEIVAPENAEPLNEFLFERARAQMPDLPPAPASFQRRGPTYFLDTPLPDDFTTREAFFFAAQEGLIKASAAQKITTSTDQLTIALEPGHVSAPDGKTLRGVLSYRDKNNAMQARWLRAAVEPPVAGPPLSSSGRPSANIVALLALAFFGGALLNIMPCVFPIVFIKAASLMKSAGAEKGAARRDGLLYAAGVVTTLGLLGAALLALRAGGEQLGWGFHLQSPIVVAMSAYILFMVGLNLFGLFHVGEGLAGAGEGLTRQSGGASAFFTGLLAVVVAAPCIGPLLSAPMGAALLLPAGMGLAIFLVMGAGLAAPYLALSFAPGLGKLLPKPGPWMVVLKQALAFPVFGAAAYFLWVFAQQTNGGALATMLAGAVFLALGAWLFERSKGDGRQALILRIVSALAVVAALAPLTRIEPSAVSAPGGETFGALTYEPYDAAALADYRRAGIPVFIDFTAAWCVTCQFDKLTIFSSGDVAAAFEHNGAVFMVADWTVRDTAITEKLNEFGASGVPFYLYYPAAGETVVFEIPLTKKAVLEAMNG